MASGKGKGLFDYLRGEGRLRGMWGWARAHQRRLLRPLDFWAAGRLPALMTL